MCRRYGHLMFYSKIAFSQGPGVETISPKLKIRACFHSNRNNICSEQISNACPAFCCQGRPFYALSGSFQPGLSLLSVFVWPFPPGRLRPFFRLCCSAVSRGGRQFLCSCLWPNADELFISLFFKGFSSWELAFLSSARTVIITVFSNVIQD